MDLHLRPAAYKTAALLPELRRQKLVGPQGIEPCGALANRVTAGAFSIEVYGPMG